MNRIPALVLFATSVLATIGTSGVANAADFASTTAAAQLSIARGFTATALPIQQRFASSTAEAVSTRIVNAVCGINCARQSALTRGNKRRVTGNGWFVDVGADSSAARFENVTLERQASSLAQDPSHAIPATTLEASARAFIASKLSSVIVLGAQEQLVPIRTDYLIAGGQDLKTRKVVHAVLANRIVFGRRLQGVPVVGGGSTVVVTYANNGEVESFRYDWPQYRSGQTQTLVPVPQIIARLNTVIAARSVSGRVPASARRISRKIAADAAVGKPNTVLQKLECGYFDPGSAARSTTASVQPGCVYHAIQRDRDGFRQGLAGAVPAGVTFAGDTGWTETTILHNRP